MMAWGVVIVVLAGVFLPVCFVLNETDTFKQVCNILQTLEDLQSRQNSTERRIQEQDKKLDETRTFLADGLTRLQEQDTELAKTRSSLTDAVKRVQEQNTEIVILKASLYELRSQSPYKTAFTARLRYHVNLGYRQTISFDDIVTNVNNCYSPSTGIFTAKTNGTFFFFASIMTYAGDGLRTEMMKNGQRVALMYNNVPNLHDQGVNGATLGLTEGDTVWVRLVDQIGKRVYGGGWSSFSGFQIR